MHHMKLAATSTELALMEYGGAGMFGAPARPLESTFVEPVIVDPSVNGCDLSYLRHDIRTGFVVHGVSQPGRDLGNDLPVRPGCPWRINGLTNPLDTALCVCKCSVFLCKAGCRQYHVSQLGRFR